jgi:mannose-6-phosphate isomerase-like protein (cupin superfamily)
MSSSSTAGPCAGTVLHVLGTENLLRLTGAETGGKYTVVEITCPPGAGIPLHVHVREDEVFHVLEGVFEFTIDGNSEMLTAGDTLRASVSVPHSFCNKTNVPARLLAIATPAGIEAMWQELAGLAPETACIEQVLEITSRYGIQMLP